MVVMVYLFLVLVGDVVGDFNWCYGCIVCIED